MKASALPKQSRRSKPPLTLSADLPLTDCAIISKMRPTFEVTGEMKKEALVVYDSMIDGERKFTNAAYFTTTLRKSYGSSVGPVA